MEKRLVKYGASWCGPCKALNQLLESITLDVKLENIDIDHNVQKAQDNNIRTIPTMILFDENGEELKRYSGVMNEVELKEFVKS